NVYIAGWTISYDLPVSSGAFQTSNAGSGYNDAFLAKFSSGGSLSWATYYGGSDEEGASGISTDASGNVYITGYTYSYDLPVSSGAYQTYLAGTYNAFLAKFSSGGSLSWATYYGGSAYDFAQGVRADAFGNVYITGYTESYDLPVTSGA